MGFLDSPILPKNSDPMLERYLQQQRQQQFWGMLSQMGQGLIAANRRGQSPISGLSAGLAQGRPSGGQGTGGLLDWMKMRQYGQGQQDRQQKQEREQARREQYQGLLSSEGSGGGPGPSGLGLTPQQQQIYSVLGVDKGAGLLAERFDPKSDVVSREREAQLGRIAQSTRAPEKPTVPKGLGPGEAYNALLEEKAYQDAGETVPIGVAQRARVARHVLQTKQYRTTPAGDVVSSVPGVPAGFGTPSQAASGQAVPQSGQTVVPSRGLRTEIEARPEINARKPLATMKKIVGLLNEAKKSGKTITGIMGTGKRLAGGLGRQVLGDEIAGSIGLGETSAKDLHRLFQTLQGQMGPIILNEKRLSETERKRLMDIVGGVVPESDEKDVRSGLADLYDFIMEYGE